MENKKYLDKVIGYLVRGTKIDYEKKIVSTPSLSFPFSLLFSLLPPLFLRQIFYRFFFSFSSYCKNTFGLTEEEIDYVWNEYREIIKNKIENDE